MTVEQEISPNIYPSAGSVRVEPIAILTPREGVRRVLFRRQALAVRAVIRFLDKMGLDETSFPSNSKKLHNDIRPGRPYKSGIINPVMLGLIPYIADLGGTITPHPSDPPAPSTYDVHLPKDVRAKIQIKRRKVPIGVTFQLPYGNMATEERAAVLHELIKDHLTVKSAIRVNRLWKLIHGDMPYSESGMSHLLSGVQQDLEGTGILVEKILNYRINENGKKVHTHSSVFLNFSAYIENLKAETLKIKESDGLPKIEETAKSLNFPASTYKTAKKVTEIAFTNFSHARQLADHLLRTLLYRHAIAVSAYYLSGSNRVSFHLGREEFIAFGLIAQRYAQSLIGHPQAQQFLNEKGSYYLTEADCSILDNYVNPADCAGQIMGLLKQAGFEHIATALQQPLPQTQELPRIIQTENTIGQGYLYKGGREHKMDVAGTLKVSKLLENINLEELAGWDYKRLEQLCHTLSELGPKRFDEARYSDIGLVVHPILHERVTKLIIAENQQAVADACQLFLHLDQMKKPRRQSFRPLDDETTTPTFGKILDAVIITLEYFKRTQEQNPGVTLDMRILTIGILNQVVGQPNTS